MESSENEDDGASNRSGGPPQPDYDEEVDESDGDESDPPIPEESKISKTLSDKTIKTVVMLVLLLLFMLALCSSEAYVDSDIMHVQGLKNLRDIYDRGEDFYPQYT